MYKRQIQGFGDDSDNATATQMLPDRARRVRLVCAYLVRTRARSAGPAPVDTQMPHQDREHRRVTSLAGTDEDDQRESAPVDEVVDLRRQTTPGPAYSVVRRLLAQILVVR